MKKTSIKCPKCRRNYVTLRVSKDLGIISTIEWDAKCHACGFEIRYLGELGTKGSALDEWRSIIVENALFNFFKKSDSFLFGKWIKQESLGEILGLTHRAMGMLFNRLVKDGFLRKDILLSHGLKTIKDGKEYYSFSLTKKGRDKFKKSARHFV